MTTPRHRCLLSHPLGTCLQARNVNSGTAVVDSVPPVVCARVSGVVLPVPRPDAQQGTCLLTPVNSNVTGLVTLTPAGTAGMFDCVCVLACMLRSVCGERCGEGGGDRWVVGPCTFPTPRVHRSAWMMMDRTSRQKWFPLTVYRVRRVRDVQRRQP